MLATLAFKHSSFPEFPQEILGESDYYFRIVNEYEQNGYGATTLLKINLIAKRKTQCSYTTLGSITILSNQQISIITKSS